MDTQLTLRSLSDDELDIVAAGHPHHSGGQQHGSSLTGNVSIGEIVVYASGNATVTIDVIGVNSTSAAAAGQHRMLHA